MQNPKKYDLWKVEAMQIEEKLNTFSKQHKTIVWAVVFILFLFAACVWPTIYRYKKTWLGQDSALVRINRITNETEILFPRGWKNADSYKTVEK